ncbi:hypothetical protein V8E51_010381 [Hyaloscypha variabilis]
MGYFEYVCQMCGSGSAWDYRGAESFVEWDEDDDDGRRCRPSSGCHRNENRQEHVAGPGCVDGRGYSGHRISMEEMKGCRAVQCLLVKKHDWEPEPDDHSFELDSKVFLTGLGDGSPDMSPLTNLSPRRHGIDETWISNTVDGGEDDGLPFHPSCFEVFKRISTDRLGVVDINGLWSYWREINGSFEALYESFPRDFAVKSGNEQGWNHDVGCEYLAANPITIPSLTELLNSCYRQFSGWRHNEPYDANEPVFFWRYKASGETHERSHFIPPPSKSSDIFMSLPNELRAMILDDLSSKDIANLRLVTPAYRQLNVSLFRRLLLEDMPWIWEARDLPMGNTDFHRLYRLVKFCWTNLKGLRNRERIWKDVSEVVTRIERYRREGKIV